MSIYKIFNSYRDQVEDANQLRGLPLYRFFKNEREAECLLDGKVWISTLQKCREFECPQQGDKAEATSLYHIVDFSIDHRVITEKDHWIASHSTIGGIDLPPPGEFYDGCLSLRNVGIHRKIQNGFLLCTTNDPDKLQEQSNEWKYGVEITLRQSKIFEILTRAIIKKGIPIRQNRHGWADYDTSRIYHDPLEAPRNLAFIKPDLHRHQSEYRFFWEAPYGYVYPNDGVLVECPEIKPYLKKLF